MSETTDNALTSATENGQITLTTANLEAKIILDWDDGQWYISDIQSGTDNSEAENTQSETSDAGGVKLATWDSGYKYAESDIVAFKGSLYVSNQNVNRGNKPPDGNFWWSPVVDLSNVDAATLEGRNLQEISREILAGNVITDYYKKTETDNIILTYCNNVNAKKLGDRTLKEIEDKFVVQIAEAEQRAKDFAVDYVNDESSTSFQQSLIDEFNAMIMSDDVNQL